LTQSVEHSQVQAVPDASLLPLAQAAPAGDATTAAEFLGQILPGQAGLEHEEDAGECRAIGDAGTSSFGFGKFGWEQRRDHLPERVADQCFGHVLATLSSTKPGRCPVL
jgi:hypothetical protein